MGGGRRRGGGLVKVFVNFAAPYKRRLLGAPASSSRFRFLLSHRSFNAFCKAPPIPIIRLKDLPHHNMVSLALQPRKVRGPIDVSESGSVMDVSEEHTEKT